jgi:dihydroxyacid dehydratase/phosphogluconate dehydratase
LRDRSLKAEISDSDWKARKAKWRPTKLKNASGILGLFGANADQADQGARLVAHPAPWQNI